MNWLQKLCDETGVSRYKIHKLSGASQTTLSDIVKKDIVIENVNFGVVSAIAKAFGMTTDELYKRTLE